jgi:4-hydroxyacetophenone monooxygenase
VDWTLTIDEISDTQLEQALSLAHVPTLMATLMHLQGSCDPLRGDIRPHVAQLAEEEDGLSEGARDKARKLALAAIIAHRDAGCPALPTPDDAMVTETMQYITGVPFPEEQLELMREELNLLDEDRRRVPVDDTSVPAGYRVLVIGSGMSGILAAIRLQQAGIDYLLVDKNPEVGGTWYENTYPGCQVDSPNHLYNYIFEPNHQWPAYFSDRKTLFNYFQGVAQRYDVRAHARLNTRVTSSTYDESSNCWRVDLEDSRGRTTQESFSAVIAACGQLNTPAMPDIPGVDSFQGITFHSARWEHQHDLSGKRVAVICYPVCSRHSGSNRADDGLPAQPQLVTACGGISPTGNGRGTVVFSQPALLRQVVPFFPVSCPGHRWPVALPVWRRGLAGTTPIGGPEECRTARGDGGVYSRAGG